MKNKFYVIGFYILLAIIIFGLVYLFRSERSDYPSDIQLEEINRERDSILPPPPPPREYLTPEEKRLRRLTDSSQMIKDSIISVVGYMNDSIELRALSPDQRNVYAETVNSLARTKLQLDFQLDKDRLQLLKVETDKLDKIIKKYDKTKEKLNRLSNRLESITKFIKTAVDILAIAASNGIIVPPVPIGSAK